jgi:(1->4)-alpha-D-glucan 1-alpha-D-glucosylmutase
MGLLIDLVPNHMGIAGNRNPRWLEMLQYGPAAPAATYFDVDWAPVKDELAGKVLLPILGDQYGAVLDSGQLKLVLDERGFSVRYYDTVLPLAPRSFAHILGHRLSELHERLGAEHAKLVELKSLIAWFTTIPSDADTGIERLGSGSKADRDRPCAPAGAARRGAGRAGVRRGHRAPLQRGCRRSAHLRPA